MIFVSTICLKGERYGVFTENVFKVLQAYKRIGVKNVELGSVHMAVDVKEIIKYKKNNDVQFTIHGFFPPLKGEFMINLASTRKDFIKKTKQVIKKAIELCNDIDSNLYGVHPGYLADIDVDFNLLSKEISFEEAFRRTAENLADVCDYANKFGVNIAIETQQSVHPVLIFNTPEHFEKIFKTVTNKNLGILIDTGHLTLASEDLGYSKKDFIEKFQSRIFEIHAHSVINGKDHQNVLPGVLRDFDRSVLKKVVVTLEATKLSPEDILKGVQVLEKEVKGTGTGQSRV